MSGLQIVTLALTVFGTGSLIYLTWTALFAVTKLERELAYAKMERDAWKARAEDAARQVDELVWLREQALVREELARGDRGEG